jgi:type VI secretion system protein ImpC
MSRPFDFGRVEISTERALARNVPHEDEVFAIAVLGNFRGNPKHAKIAIAERPLISVDRDNLDDVIAQAAPGLYLPLRDVEPLTLQFKQLEDFHPDRLFENSDFFDMLRALRLRVQDPATFQSAVEELGLHTATRGDVRRSAAAASLDSVMAHVAPERKGSLLEDIVEQADGPATERPSRRDQLQAFVQRVTEPHLVQHDDRLQAQVLGVLDRAISAQMRALLHTPDFQQLEAGWRGMDFLVRRIETGSQLKVYLVNISQEELIDDLLDASNIRDSQLHRLLIERTIGTPGAEPLTLLVGNYTFGSSAIDLEALGRMAQIAMAAKAPFVAAASPRLLGCQSLVEAPHPREWKTPLAQEADQAWKRLRQLPEAAWVGLALPRFLLRLPYGKETDPAESFDFEEMPGIPEHEHYLWGYPAFACAVLLAQSFSEEGWHMRPGMHTEIGRLPLHVYKRNGETVLKPCAEVLLTENAAERILETGLMPLVSLRGTDNVKLLRMQSIAQAMQSLKGHRA